jgi:hypothetical protein
MWIVGQELVLDFDIKVALVLVIGLVRQSTFDLLPTFDSKNFLQIEHRLLPVRVFRVWAGRELDRLVACRELNVKPCDDSMDEIATPAVKREVDNKGEILGCDSVQVKGEDAGGISYYGLHVDRVYEGFSHGSGLERSVIEAPDVVPDWRS